MFTTSDNKKALQIIGIILTLYVINSMLAKKQFNIYYFSFLILTIIIWVYSIVIHEVTHGLVAYWLGDDTAYKNQRLTLNPLNHLDPIGILAIILINIGWAKPVPINFSALKKPRRDIFLVAIAGPISNFLLAILLTIILKFLSLLFNFQLNDLNSITLKFNTILIATLSTGIFLNLALGFFNLIPIPPLDGSKILMSILTYPYVWFFIQIEKYGFIILLILLYFNIITPLIFMPTQFFYLKLLHFVFN